MKRFAAWLVDSIVKKRRTGAHLLYQISQRIAFAYHNSDVDMESNGEEWLIKTFSDFDEVTAVDVGANKGEWTARVLYNVKNSKIYCYEPIPQTFKELKKSIHSKRAKLFNVGLSSIIGTIQIKRVVDSPDLSTVYDIDRFEAGHTLEVIDVDVTTGDIAIHTEHIEHIHFLKVDAEGHDYDVLLGFSGALLSDQIDVIQFEYNHFTNYAGRSLFDFYELLKERFVICRLLPNGLEACGYHPVLDNYMQSNWVALRQSTINSDAVDRFRLRKSRGLPGLAFDRYVESFPDLAFILDAK